MGVTVPKRHNLSLDKNYYGDCGYVGAAQLVGVRTPSVHVCPDTSVMSDSLWHHGPQSTRLLCPWDFEARILEWVCHFLLWGIFPTQGLNLHLLWLLALVGVFFNTEPPALSKNGHSSIHQLLTIHYVFLLSTSNYVYNAAICMKNCPKITKLEALEYFIL